MFVVVRTGEAASEWMVALLDRSDVSLRTRPWPAGRWMRVPGGGRGEGESSWGRTHREKSQTSTNPQERVDSRCCISPT